MAMTNDNQHLLKKLKEALQKSIEIASDAKDTDMAKWARWELRKEYIKSEIINYSKLAYGSSIPKRVFISYTKNNGQEYYNLLKEKLEKEGFTVTDGFQSSTKSAGIVIRSILDQMKSATVYVGIYTKENKIHVKDKEFWTPSVWTIEEKGMALGLNLPVMLIMEEGIHEDFFSKTTGSFEHCITKNAYHFEHNLLEKSYALILAKYLDKKSKYREEEDFDLFEF